MKTLEYRCSLPVPARLAFNWHARPGALERLTPPWEPTTIIRRTGGITDGSHVVVRVYVGPFPVTVHAEHFGYVDGVQFCDRLSSGPFAHFEHLHKIEPDGQDACTLIDRITFKMRFGLAGRLAEGMVVRRLDRMFRYRHRVTTWDCQQAAEAAARGRPLRVLVSGATGLLGAPLVDLLTTAGHEVARLVRRPKSPRAGDIRWDPERGELDPAALEGFDAVVHLAGENVGGKRWTPRQKQRLRASRIQGTDLLARTLAGLKSPPQTLVCASAVGFYGDRGDEELTETSAAGDGFLPELCREWEAAAVPASERGIRVVNLRFGVVFTPAGGALRQMLLPFRLGAGGVVGSGRQYMPWISADDAVGVVHHALLHPELSGPVNAVAPQAVRNREFTRTLGRVLRRPTLIPLPSFAARLALGEMADGLLLASARVAPRRLLESGYSFRLPDLDAALRHVLGT